ncbi:hypothetical protein HGRIS_006074 [Hohenbuehelia grisea]|uniref:Ribokinase n=1 Tax=Hohenbuehelia grisea TaxID=104357 RepID=A0ABR3JZ25_9AGAR
MVRKSLCLVRGSINNDEYFHVKSLVRPGQTIYSKGFSRRAGGKGANQAVAIARATLRSQDENADHGPCVEFEGSVGDDGTWLLDYLAAFGVSTARSHLVENATGRAIIQVAQDGENSIILFPGANHALIPLPSTLDPKYTHLLLQNEIPLETTVHYMRLSKSSRLASASNGSTVTTIFNPSPLPSSVELASIPWDCVDWLIVNEDEALALLESFSADQTDSGLQTPSPSANRDEDTLRSLLNQLSNHPLFSALTNIICTRGARGVVALAPSIPKSGKDEPVYVSLPAATLSGPVVDTTGAGDCFAGYFVCGLMELTSGIYGNDLESILQRSVEASGMCVQKNGTIDSIPLRADVEPRMK